MGHGPKIFDQTGAPSITADQVVVGNGSGITSFNNLTFDGENLNHGSDNTILNSVSSSIITASSSYLSNSLFSKIDGGVFLTMSTSVFSSLSGYRNCIDQTYLSSIIGGKDNKMCVSNETIILGGHKNYLGSCTGCSTIVGGHNNSISNNLSSSIIGGDDNVMNFGKRSIIAGGFNNAIQQFSYNSSIISSTNSIVCCHSCSSGILGGSNNRIFTCSCQSSVISGINNYIYTQSCNSSIVSGDGNRIQNSCNSVIIGGIGLTLSNECSLVYVPELKMWTSQQDDTLGKIMVWDDTSSKKLKWRDVNTISGGGGNIIPGACELVFGNYSGTGWTSSTRFKFGFSESNINIGCNNIISGSSIRKNSIINGSENNIIDSKNSFINNGIFGTISGSTFSGMIGSVYGCIENSNGSIIIGGGLENSFYPTNYSNHILNSFDSIIIGSSTQQSGSPYYGISVRNSEIFNSLSSNIINSGYSRIDNSSQSAINSSETSYICNTTRSKIDNSSSSRICFGNDNAILSSNDSRMYCTGRSIISNSSSSCIYTFGGESFNISGSDNSCINGQYGFTNCKNSIINSCQSKICNGQFDSISNSCAVSGNIILITGSSSGCSQFNKIDNSVRGTIRNSKFSNISGTFLIGGENLLGDTLIQESCISNIINSNKSCVDKSCRVSISNSYLSIINNYSMKSSIDKSDQSKIFCSFNSSISNSFCSEICCSIESSIINSTNCGSGDSVSIISSKNSSIIGSRNSKIRRAERSSIINSCYSLINRTTETFANNNLIFNSNFTEIISGISGASNNMIAMSCGLTASGCNNIVISSTYLGTSEFSICNLIMQSTTPSGSSRVTLLGCRNIVIGSCIIGMTQSSDSTIIGSVFVDNCMSIKSMILNSTCNCISLSGTPGAFPSMLPGYSSGNTIISSECSTIYFNSSSAIITGMCNAICSGSSVSSIISGVCSKLRFSPGSSILSSKVSYQCESNLSSIIGGRTNCILCSCDSLILGGSFNTIQNSCNTIILGGTGSTITGQTNLVKVPKLNVDATLGTSSYGPLVWNNSDDKLVSYIDTPILSGTFSTNSSSVTIYTITLTSGQIFQANLRIINSNSNGTNHISVSYDMGAVNNNGTVTTYSTTPTSLVNGQSVSISNVGTTVNIVATGAAGVSVWKYKLDILKNY